MHTKFVSESSYLCFMCDLYGQEAAEDLKLILQEKQLEVDSEKPGPHSGQRSSKRARGLGDSESLRSSGHADVPGPDSSPEPCGSDNQGSEDELEPEGHSWSSG